METHVPQFLPQLPRSWVLAGLEVVTLMMNVLYRGTSVWICKERLSNCPRWFLSLIHESPSSCSFRSSRWLNGSFSRPLLFAKRPYKVELLESFPIDLIVLANHLCSQVHCFSLCALLPLTQLAKVGLTVAFIRYILGEEVLLDLLVDSPSGCNISPFCRVPQTWVGLLVIGLQWSTHTLGSLLRSPDLELRLFLSAIVTQTSWATRAVSLGVSVGTAHSLLFALTHVIVNVGGFGFQLYSLVVHYEKEERVTDAAIAISGAYVELISGVSWSCSAFHDGKCSWGSAHAHGVGSLRKRRFLACF